jgi:hypothetical protein
MKKILLIISIFALYIYLPVSASKNDTLRILPKPIHKNVIKFNPTPMMLWSSKNVTLSYERILGPRQSIAITVGYLEFPKLFKDTIANLVAITSRHKQGINIALEYRFYLMKRNARPVPDGLYIAPFVSYYGYQFRNDVNILHTSLDSAGMVKGSFYIFNIGAELGYQFIFWKRLSVDFVLLGPCASYYGGGVDITGNINAADLENINKDLYDRLKEKYPKIQDFVVNKSFRESGRLDLFGVGFRYLVQIGFHF